MWVFLVLIILLCLAAPPSVLLAAILFYRSCVGLKPPIRYIARIGIVSLFGPVFILSASVPLTVLFAPLLLQQPMVQKIIHYDPKKSFRQNVHKISEQWVPYESPR